MDDFLVTKTLGVADLQNESSPLPMVDRTADVREVANLLRYAKFRADNLGAVIREDIKSNESNQSILDDALEAFRE
jgi:hypothetical protein